MDDLVNEILSYVVVAVLVAMSVWLGSAIKAVLERIAQKLNFQGQLVSDEMIERAVVRLVSAAEEIAARRAKVNPEDVMRGAEKAQWVKDQIERLFPHLISDDVEARIDAALARLRGVGATGDTSVGQDSVGSSRSGSGAAEELVEG